MAEVSYKKLWKLLIDRNMRKEDLRQQAKLSAGTIAKLGKDGNVTTEVLAKICDVLSCDIGDVCEIVKQEES